MAAGFNSFVAGFKANNANSGHSSVFLFSDGSIDATFDSVTANEFAVRAAGGFRFRTQANLGTGCNLPGGSGVFSCTSDENAKTDLVGVDPEDVLRKVAKMPISTWRYKTEEGARHMGPTAQAFHAAFGLGGDDKTIGHIDADGVALAAIQGLHRKMEERDRETEQRDREIAALRSEMERRDREITALRSDIAGRDVRLASLEAALADLTRQVRAERPMLEARVDGSDLLIGTVATTATAARSAP